MITFCAVWVSVNVCFVIDPEAVPEACLSPDVDTRVDKIPSDSSDIRLGHVSTRCHLKLLVMSYYKTNTL